MTSSTKHANLTWLPFKIMHCGHTRHDNLWPRMSLTWLLYNLELWRHRRWFWKFTIPFRPILKEIASSMLITWRGVYSNRWIIKYCFQMSTAELAVFIVMLKTTVGLVGRAPGCCAEGRGFKPRPDQHSGSLNNWGERAAFVTTPANG